MGVPKFRKNALNSSMPNRPSRPPTVFFFKQDEEATNSIFERVGGVAWLSEVKLTVVSAHKFALENFLVERAFHEPSVSHAHKLSACTTRMRLCSVRGARMGNACALSHRIHMNRPCSKLSCARSEAMSVRRPSTHDLKSSSFVIAMLTSLMEHTMEIFCHSGTFVRAPRALNTSVCEPSKIYNVGARRGISIAGIVFCVSARLQVC